MINIIFKQTSEALTKKYTPATKKVVLLTNIDSDGVKSASYLERDEK